jgi:hypothetical protein
MFRLAVLVLLAVPCSAWGTSYAPPQRRDVYSPNRQFILDVNPETGVHSVYAVADRTRELWSFKLSVWLFDFALSNDGKVVAVVFWQHLHAEDVEEAVGVGFWNDGGLFRSYAVGELCPLPAHTRTWWGGHGPIGEFWRTWHDKVARYGDTLTVRTTGGWEYDFHISDGSIQRRRMVVSAWCARRANFILLAGVVALAVACLRRWRRVRKPGVF